MNILLVDDEKDIRTSLSKFIQKLGHITTIASNTSDAIKVFDSHHFDVVLTDICMPGKDGIQLLHHIKKVQKSKAKVIIITGYGDTDRAVKALRYGAYDFLQKPIDIKNLAEILDDIKDSSFLDPEVVRKNSENLESIPLSGNTAGKMCQEFREVSCYGKIKRIFIHSKAIREVFSLVEKYACDNTIPILIEGESGTGKELVAHYLHQCACAKGITPFVAINCGAIPTPLFEGELFGHEKNSFTGASNTGHKGKIESAADGLLFLDEIGELPWEMQVKFLRVLETKTIQRIGGTQDVPVNFRLVSATNKKINEEVARGKFRLDLFYRINVGYIYIPPLCERKEEIIPLATQFAKDYSKMQGKSFLKFSKDAEAFLYSYPWPGNIRELKNTIRRAALLSSNGAFELNELTRFKDHLNVDQNGNKKPSNIDRLISDPKFDLPDEGFDLEKIQRLIIERALVKHGGNKSASARYLGISRRVLQGRLKNLKLE